MLSRRLRVLQSTSGAVVIVGVQLSLLRGHLLAPVLIHPPTDLRIEHFDFSEAHVFLIDVSVVDPLLHEILGNSIDE